MSLLQKRSELWTLIICPRQLRDLRPSTPLYFTKKKPHDNVMKLSKEEDVELIESSDPSKEIKKINERFSTDKYDVIIKSLEDLRATMMDVM